MRIQSEVYKTRDVYGKTWEMQISFIKGSGYQATYFYGAEEKVWGKCLDTAEAAALDLDRLVDKHFGIEQTHYVKVGRQPEVPIKGFEEALKFCHMWNAVLLTEIRNP